MSLVTEHLIARGVVFEVIPHRRVLTSLQEARELGVAAPRRGDSAPASSVPT
jgi:hypothetical protein